MRKAAALITGLLLLVSVTGCATPADRHSYQKVKCPACGYEFASPRN